MRYDNRRTMIDARLLAKAVEEKAFHAKARRKTKGRKGLSQL
jgi:hypothetical protein